MGSTLMQKPASTNFRIALRMHQYRQFQGPNLKKKKFWKGQSPLPNYSPGGEGNIPFPHPLAISNFKGNPFNGAQYTSAGENL